MLFKLIVFFVVIELSLGEIVGKSDVEYDVIVLGSGVSGLSAASYLSTNGKKVLVIERMNIGGSLQTFYRTGTSGKTYSFEPGIHYIGNAGLDILDSMAGKKLEMFQMKSIDYLYVNKTSDPYTLSKQPKFEEYLMSLFPSESESITNYFISLEATKDPKKMMYDIITTTNPVLRYLMTFMTQGHNIPVVIYQMFFNYYYESGACYPVGAANAIINATVNVITTNGGKIIPKCEATKLLFDDENEHVSGVKTDCGEFTTQNIISSMNFQNTFNDKFIDSSILKKFNYTSQMLDISPGSTSMLFFLGFNVSNDILNFPVANMRFMNKLPVTESSIFDRNSDDPTTTFSFSPPWFFATALSVRDPDYPKDRTSLFVMTDVDYTLFQKWEDSVTHERPAGYYTFKQKFTDALHSLLWEFFPEAEKYLDVSTTSSPLTIRDYLNHPNGEIYGSVKKSWFDYTTNIPGLLMCGQDITGDGVFPAANSGQVVAKMILGDSDD